MNPGRPDVIGSRQAKDFGYNTVPWGGTPIRRRGAWRGGEFLFYYWKMETMLPEMLLGHVPKSWQS